MLISLWIFCSIAFFFNSNFSFLCFCFYMSLLFSNYSKSPLMTFTSPSSFSGTTCFHIYSWSFLLKFYIYLKYNKYIYLIILFKKYSYFQLNAVLTMYFYVSSFFNISFGAGMCLYISCLFLIFIRYYSYSS